MQTTVSSVINSMAGAQPDSMAEGPFTIDCMLPTQFTERRPIRCGEERLMFAVLEDAVNCFFGDVPKARMESTLWFKDRGATGPFAFESICQVLGFDADWLRRGLFKQLAMLKEKKQSEAGQEKFSNAA